VYKEDGRHKIFFSGANTESRHIEILCVGVREKDWRHYGVS
jgi:hypothetical protein